MAGITEVYPTHPDIPAIVRGDPLVIPVTFTDHPDLTGWEFRSHLRTYPDAVLIAEADITIEGNVVTLSYSPEQTALLKGNEGFDLEQIAPIWHTWWIVRTLRVERDYSHV